MGIDQSTVQFLQACRRDGVDFGSTLTLGRQELYLSSWQAEQVGVEPGVACEQFADSLLRSLGAEELAVMDASDFEGADIVHDLNLPLPVEHHGQYSLVIDAGTLEHVFDVPVALRSVLSAVRPGGHFVSITPTNNESGHGFYQFSPELWFRVLSPENGYELEELLIREMHPQGRWYRVSDPAVLGGRVGFVTRKVAYLFVRARRVEAVEPLRSAPQQSDYALRWDGGAARSLSTVRELTPMERVRKSLRIRRQRLEDRVRVLRGREVVDPFRRVHFEEHVKHFEPISAP